MSKRYTKDHEWISAEGGVGTVGISDYAQQQLGDVVFVELPELGKAIGRGEPAAVVESVKAASEVYAPAGGTVIEVNAALNDAPATVNESAEGEGWFVKLRLSNPAEVESLMDEAAYTAFLETL
jgi:glycine cleavage system H protein